MRAEAHACFFKKHRFPEKPASEGNFRPDLTVFNSGRPLMPQLCSPEDKGGTSINFASRINRHAISGNSVNIHIIADFNALGIGNFYSFFHQFFNFQNILTVHSAPLMFYF